jgi:hypothetical protein
MVLPFHGFFLLGKAKSMIRQFMVGGAVIALAAAGSPISHADTFDTVLSGSFASYSALESNWNYLYPWGPHHNGSAYMVGSSTDHSHVSVAGNVLTLSATRLATALDGKYNYYSGAIYAKQQITVSSAHPTYEIKGDFQVPTTKGAWPAFWLTAVSGWPPEADILEYKGDSTNWFNTFRSSSDVSTTKVGVSNAGSWHTYRAWLSKSSDTDITIDYYIDGVWKARHTANFVGKPMWLIMNLQMEGSSGTPGPSGTTTYAARNVYVGRSTVG